MKLEYSVLSVHCSLQTEILCPEHSLGEIPACRSVMPRGFYSFLLFLPVLFPGGGHVRIENVKLDFKEKAHAKVGSLDNASHTPGGGNVMVKTAAHKYLVHTKSLLLSVSVNIKKSKQP